MLAECIRSNQASKAIIPHYNHRFRGKINGARGESFSLENLEKEIHKGFNLTFQELQMMSNKTITLQNI